MSFYEKSKLENGLVVVTETVPDVRSVALGFWVGVGSRNEEDKESGMSHFLEHLLFKGTLSRSGKEISETFDSLGAEINAFTTKEFTCFYTRLLDEHLATGLEILADMLQNPLFNPEHIEFERQVVLEEIALYEDTPDEQIHDLFAATLWPTHPLGKQVLGTLESVKSYSSELIKNFFNRFYLPQNIVLAAAGRVKHEQFRDLVQKYFKRKEKGKREITEVTAPIKSRLAVFNKPTEQVHLCYGTTALNAHHPDRFILSVLENIIGGGMSSRLFQKIREEKGLAYSVYSYHSLYQETGNIAIYAGTRPNNVKEVLQIIGAELESITQKEVEPKELKRAKEHLKGQLVLGLESTRNRMTRLGKSELIQGEILSVEELVARVNKVTAEDVQKLAQEIFSPEKMVLTVIGPLKEEEIAPSWQLETVR